MTWFSVLKIRADVYGVKLKMPDYHNFVKELKLALRPKVKQYHDKDLLPNGEPKPGAKKSFVRVNRKAGVETSGGFWFTVSGLNASTGERYVYRFDIKEHDGDLFYETVVGPGVFYGVTSTLDNEEQLIIDIATEIGKIHEKWQPPKADPREIMDEVQAEHSKEQAELDAFAESEKETKPNLTTRWRERLRRWRGRND